MEQRGSDERGILAECRAAKVHRVRDRFVDVCLDKGDQRVQQKGGGRIADATLTQTHHFHAGEVDEIDEPYAHIPDHPIGQFASRRITRQGKRIDVVDGDLCEGISVALLKLRDQLPGVANNGEPTCVRLEAATAATVTAVSAILHST